MATAPTEIAGTPERVRHPLEVLRATIRKYVALEGALSIGLFLVLWFWIGLALDYGTFKLLAFDWVQELPRWFRGGLLSLVIAGLTALVITQLIRRLTVDFHPKALALVLERHFPTLLGDRLITAVELADADRAAADGYSRPMLEETVREAAARLAAAPVGEVFEWRRLKRMAQWLLGWLVVPGLAFGVVYSIVRHSNPIIDFVPRFRETAWTWLQRDVLLQNVIWPRKAYLEILDFPENGDLRIARDAPAPRLRFRARKWIVADGDAPEGWRAMLWADLRPGILGRDPPELPTEFLQTGLTPHRAAVANVVGLIAAPSVVPTPPPPPTSISDESWTIDRVEIALNDESIRKQLADNAPHHFAELTQTLEALERRSQRASMRSVFRRLEVPDRVDVKYWGEQTSNRLELSRGPGWEYTGPLSDLRESVQFRARGADYYTSVRSITLVPPPALQELWRIEYRPAYIYHRPPLDDPGSLRGLRQRVVDVVGLNGPASRFAVPFGTKLILAGTLDKELDEAVIRTRGQSTGAELKLTEDRLGFRHEFAEVVAPLDVDLDFTDTNGVKSTRRVIVEVFRDPAPLVNVAIDGIRYDKERGTYLATPSALIPFDGKIADGPAGTLGGLERVEYQLSIARLESASRTGTHVEWLSGALLPLIDGRPATMWTSAFATAETTKLIVGELPAATQRSFPLDTFVTQRDRGRRDATTAQLQARLEQPPDRTNPNLREFILQPKFEGLDLKARMAELKVTGDLDVQPRYRMKLTVVATDNNIETGPGISANKEPPFTVLIVSEPELLVEIAREEEALHLKTEDALQRLREARLKLEKVGEEMGAADANLPTLGQRSQEVAENAARARDTTQEVFNDYSKILRELDLNRVGGKLIEKVNIEIVLPLESILRTDFARAEEAVEAVRKTFEAGQRPSNDAVMQAKTRLDRVIERLSQVMNAMGDVSNINKLIAALRDIEKGQEQAIGTKLKELQRIKRQQLIEDLQKKGGAGDK